MTTPVIRVINNAGLPAKEVRAACRAVQKQLSRDFAPDWKRTARITTYGRRKADWNLVLANTIDVPNALGYHTYNGIPTAIVDVQLSNKYGPWTICFSHEVLEMVGDPTCNLVMPFPGGKQVAYESADPVEGQNCAYQIEGVWVSDFVLQAWFTGRGSKYDFTGVLKAPLTLAPQGYIALWDGTQWTQVFGDHVDADSRAYAARRHRYRMGL
jgi:hypothetical protein